MSRLSSTRSLAPPLTTDSCSSSLLPMNISAPNTIDFCEFCGHKPFYSISVSGAFLGTSLPPTPSWSRFDLHVYTYVYSIVFNCISNYTLYFMYCIITNCKDRACSTPPFFYKVLFCFLIFCHYFSVSVVFFCSCE